MAVDNSLSFKTNFLLTFSRLPLAQYFIQDLTLPAVNLGTTQVPTSNLDFSTPGDKLSFDPVTFSFLIDENYNNYIEAFNWINAFRPPTGEAASNAGIADASIIILNNNKKPILKITYVDCFPTSLDGAIYDVSAEGDDPQIANLTLEYSYYFFEKINQI